MRCNMQFACLRGNDCISAVWSLNREIGSNAWYVFHTECEDDESAPVNGCLSQKKEEHPVIEDRMKNPNTHGMKAEGPCLMHGLRDLFAHGDDQGIDLIDIRITHRSDCFAQSVGAAVRPFEFQHRAHAHELAAQGVRYI